MRHLIAVRTGFFGAVLGAALLLGAGGAARAASFSFAGSFAQDNDVRLFGFGLNSAATVTLRTYSYAGGVNAAWTTIYQGGFDPILTLFGAGGEYLTYNDDGTSSTVGIDSNTGKAYDSYFQASLQAGAYTVALTQYNNLRRGPNIGDGFSYRYSGDSFFTSMYGCSNGRFCDAHANNRTNQWAFDVSGADSAVALTAVPLPASLPLFLTGLAGLGLAGRRRRKGNNLAA